MLLKNLRSEVVKAGKTLVRTNLISSIWGSLAVLDSKTGFIAVKPSGMDCSSLSPLDVVIVNDKGEKVAGERKPSSETPTFITIFKHISMNAIVHTHSTFATVFASLGKEIPVYLAELAEAVGGSVPVIAEYKRFGTQDLGLEVVKVLKNKRGVLLRGHGVIALGRSLSEAVYTATVIEEAAKIALFASMLGEPTEISEKEIEELYKLHWTSYGQQEEL